MKIIKITKIIKIKNIIKKIDIFYQVLVIIGLYMIIINILLKKSQYF